jgi:transcriptional regulator with GAF, ATPase, and Fis domain
MKFSKEVAVLKHMGFNDEDRIVRALCETNGNVKLAAQLLENPRNEVKAF